MLNVFRLYVDRKIIVLVEWYHPGSRGRGLDPVKMFKPPPPPLSITNRSKAVLLMWFLNAACYVCMYMVFSNMVS